MTPASPIELVPCETPVSRSRKSEPNPLAPGGGAGPSVTQTTRTEPGLLPSTVGQLTVRPLLPRNSDWTSAVNAVLLAGGEKLSTDWSNVVITSNPPRLLIPWTAISIVACAP